MVSKIFVYIIVFTLFITLGVYGFSFAQTLMFASLSEGYVEVESLLIRPEFYNNKSICTVGRYTYGFEKSALGSVSKGANGTIWVAAPVKKTLVDKLWTQLQKEGGTTLLPIGICGTFQSAEDKYTGFGPLEAYRYQIIMQ